MARDTDFVKKVKAVEDPFGSFPPDNHSDSPELGTANVTAMIALYHDYRATGTVVSECGTYPPGEKLVGAHMKDAECPTEILKKYLEIIPVTPPN